MGTLISITLPDLMKTVKNTIKTKQKNFLTYTWILLNRVENCNDSLLLLKVGARANKVGIRMPRSCLHYLIPILDSKTK